MSQKSRRRTLDPKFQPSLQALVEKLGHRAAADHIGIHAETILAALAGLRCNGSTIKLIELSLDK